MLWFIILFFVAIALLFTFSKLNAGKLKKRQLAGLDKIEHLKSLISLIQQHRGLSSALINGDKSVEYKLLNQERNIASLIGKLNDTNIDRLNCRWASFLDHWQRLKRVYIKSDALNTSRLASIQRGGLTIKRYHVCLKTLRMKALLRSIWNELRRESHNKRFTLVDRLRWREVLLAPKRTYEANTIPNVQEFVDIHRFL
ncbi:MAG: hypothetical protein MK214_14570 [Thalassotalea sp.]|nr:hypothetical protein [Thalassotalea sp.]